MSDYQWPRVTAIHPEHGSYQLDVHCLRDSDGAMVLVAFHGKPSNEQVPRVRLLAEALGAAIEPLAEQDISHELAANLAAHFYDNPGSGVCVMQVQRPGENPGG